MYPTQKELEGYPQPLEFFRQDRIHEDNQQIVEHEQMRWRLLTWRERMKLSGYVASLRRQLRRAKFNALIRQYAALRQHALQLKAAYKEMTGEERATARGEMADLKREAGHIRKRLEELQPLYALFTHYAGWLEYERAHRAELKAEAAKEKRINAEMRRESKWLEQLLLGVFRMTSGCHHIYKSEKGKERTKTPKFERCVIKPDAHYFYLAASRRTFLGWRWLLPYGVTITRLTEEEVIANMRAATKRQVDAIWSDTGQLMFRVSRLDSPDALPKEVLWRKAMDFFPQARVALFPYCIGVKEDRKFQYEYLVNDPHILVAGKSQSGKSNLVNGIIATLASTHTPAEWRVVLIDQKGGLEFSHWYELPHVLGDVIKTVDGVEPALTRLVAIMRSRMTIMEKVKAKDINAYNSRVDVEHRLARVTVVIDEMNTFVGLGQLTEDIHNLIMLLVSQGRAVGIHVIASTQHPEVKVIPGRIKTNMSMRLSGAMPTVTASMIVLDNPEAARIPNIPGRFVAVIGLKTLTVQVPRCFDEDIAGVVSATRKQYPDVSEELQDFANAPKIKVWDEARVLETMVELFEGRLTPDDLNLALGDESPGQRHLRRIARRILDEVSAVGYIERNGQRYKIKRTGKAYILVPTAVDTPKPNEPNEPNVQSAIDLVHGSPFGSPEAAPEALPAPVPEPDFLPETLPVTDNEEASHEEGEGEPAVRPDAPLVGSDHMTVFDGSESAGIPNVKPRAKKTRRKKSAA